MYVNFFKSTIKVSNMSITNIDQEKNKLTVCPKNADQVMSPGSIDCKSSNCSMSLELSCPRESDPPEMRYCCQAMKFDNSWIECCDADTYGTIHLTTKNIIFIYLIILCPIFSIICCPCSPMFRKFRRKLWRMGKKNHVDDRFEKKYDREDEEGETNPHFIEYQPQSVK